LLDEKCAIGVWLGTLLLVAEQLAHAVQRNAQCGRKAACGRASQDLEPVNWRQRRQAAKVVANQPKKKNMPGQQQKLKLGLGGASLL